MSALVIAEHNNTQLLASTLSTLQAALKLHPAVDVLVIGYNCASVADEMAEYEGVNEVICADNPVYEQQLAENTAELVAELSSKYAYLLAPANTFGKNLMPRVAGLIGVGQISDITQVIDAATFIRPIYAGNAYETVESTDPIKIITVRTTMFAPVGKTSQKAPIKNEAKVIENTLSKVVGRQLTKSDRPELTAAKIVVSGGRGLQNADNFKLLEQLAQQLGAAIGASRAAVDAGFVPNDYQVGQTGKVVAPDLYIAIGISGAIQHIAGMKDSKVIVAINKDPDAPIFAVADYGLVGDLFKVLPELQLELTKLGYTG
ncbi:MAG: electron transfer flavoprotein subunit alpha/FixB family protein [Gammaproteobacteria bacterium]|nr:electron transfer flavoprotein subunit alpha/FixB family protein [Gammaproteobacteria bacterium]